MDTNTLSRELRLLSVEEIVKWMVENLGHKQLKTCVKRISNEENVKVRRKSTGTRPNKKTNLKRKTL
jgi:hypothetical protein